MRTQQRASDRNTAELPFDGPLILAQHSAHALPPKSEELENDVVLLHLDQTAERARARFGLGIAAYPSGSVETEMASILSKVMPYLCERSELKMFARSPNEAELHNLSILYKATSCLIEVDSVMLEKIDFLNLCLENKAELKADEIALVLSIRTQGLKAKSSEAAFLAPNEVALLNEFWCFKSEFEESWAHKTSRPALHVVSRQSGSLGQSGFIWTNVNGEWQPKMQGTRYKNSTLLDMLNRHYLDGIVDPEKLSRLSRNGAAQRKEIVALARQVVEEKLSREDFLVSLYSRFPPAA